MTIDQKALKEFESLAKALPEDIEAKSPKELCTIYNTVKPVLERALPLIELIPVYGRTVAQGIRFLMGIADSACPI
jgi:hypothetical protein